MGSCEKTTGISSAATCRYPCQHTCNEAHTLIRMLHLASPSRAHAHALRMRNIRCSLPRTRQRKEGSLLQSHPGRPAQQLLTRHARLLLSQADPVPMPRAMWKREDTWKDAPRIEAAFRRFFLACALAVRQRFSSSRKGLPTTRARSRLALLYTRLCFHDPLPSHLAHPSAGFSLPRLSLQPFLP